MVPFASKAYTLECPVLHSMQTVLKVILPIKQLLSYIIINCFNKSIIMSTSPIIVLFD